MNTGRPLRLCIFASIMRRHRGYFTPHTGLVARALTDLGHEVTVLTAALPEGGGAVEVEDGVEVHYLAGVAAKKNQESFWTASAEAFDRLHAQRPFDIVFARGVASWGYFHYSRHGGEVPVILHEGTYPRWLHQVETRAGWLAPVLTKLLAPAFALKNRKAAACMQRAARVVCITPALAAAVRRNLWWHPPNALSVTYGFDTSRWHPRLPTPGAAPRLVSVGRLAWDKGVLPMIEVLSRAKNRSVTLEVMGPGADKVKQRLLGRSRDLGVDKRYSLAGPVQNEELPNRLAGASAFLFPSTHAEGLGKVVLEAMAAGLPVLAYRLPVLEGIIEDGVTGFLVPIRSPSAMTERVDQLLADPALQARMGAAARRKIETDFSPAAIQAQWRALLSEVVAEANQRQGG